MSATHATPFHAAGLGEAGPRTPWRAIALLTIVVAAAHVLLLGVAPTGTDLTAPETTNHFTTRTIALPPPAAAALPAPSPAPAKAAAAPVAVSPPKPAAPKRPAPVPPKVPKPASSIAPPAPAPTPAAAPPAAIATPSEAPVASATPTADATASVSPINPVDAGAPSIAAAGGTEGGFGSSDTGGSAGGRNAGAGTSADASAGAGAVTPPAPARVPGSIRLTFLVTAQRGPQPLSGAFGELIWKQEGDRYEAQLSAKLLMFVLTRWTSSGSIGPNGILPERYADTRKTPVAAHFVRDRGEIVFSNNSPTAPLLPGAQDRLSVLMQLGGVLSAEPARYPAGSKVSVQTASTKEADVWVFNIGADEKLQLPAGEVNAVKLTRMPRRPNDQKVELWLSRDHGYLPARLVLTDPDGNWADFQMRELVPTAAR